MSAEPVEDSRRTTVTVLDDDLVLVESTDLDGGNPVRYRIYRKPFEERHRQTQSDSTRQLRQIKYRRST